MTSPRRRRLWQVAAVTGLLACTAALALLALRDNLMFFYTPSQVQQHGLRPGERFRMGGLVERGSLERTDNSLVVRFVVADGQRRVPVHYEGLLPDLFGEDKGVVATGQMDAQGVFRAHEVLAKHDETYQPPGTAGAANHRPAWVLAP